MLSWPKRQNNNHSDTDSLFDLPLQPPLPQFSNGINKAASRFTKEICDKVANFSANQAQQTLSNTTYSDWQKRGQKRALQLFRATAEHVPAYKDFLKKHKIRPDKIKTIEDFKRLPIVDKENYLRHYPLDQLTWYGQLSSSQIISFSSGSSGEPFFWPRGQILEAETTLEHELFLTSFFDINEKSTLFINCFSMGMYVAGVITLSSIQHLGQKGYPITITTPGIDMEDIIRVVPNLNKQYEQVVIAGYPPYIKDVLDEGVRAGINWREIPIKFLLAGEGYSETWRKHISKIVKNDDPIYGFINLYGSADAAVLGHETPASIITRTRLSQDKPARQKLFHSDQLPSLVQYYPEHKYFEQVDDEIIFTTTGGIPLIRYNIHDKGGLLNHQSFSGVIPELQEHYNELKNRQHFWDLPYIYIFGKSDSTIMLYGLNIYPDNIKTALEKQDIQDQISGRFTMEIDYNNNMDQYLLLNIELASGLKSSPSLNQDICDTIVTTLKKLNREYQKLFNSIGNKAIPVIHLHECDSCDLFTRSGKQNWIN